MKTSCGRVAFLVAAAMNVAGAARSRAQTYDFSAATAWLAQNLAAYPAGVLVQIYQDDRLIFDFRSGEVTPDSVLRIASATKWISSAVILRLADSGRLDLDARIGDSLPIFDFFGKGDVTIRQCFAMTSGLYENQIDYETSPLLTLEQAADLIAANTPIVFPPGTQLAYEGDGMEAAGRSAEVVTNVEWRALAAQEVAAPLGLATLDYGLLPVNPCVPGGALLSPADYQRFLRMVLVGGRAADGSLYLSPASARAWFTNQSRGLPEYDSPWPPYPYPYGERPDYGHGAWILADNPATGLVEEVASPGKFGSFPWVDRRRRLRGLISTDSANGFADSVYTDLVFLDLVRAAVDARLLFTDGFASGTTAAWSAAAP
jgi:CubicO group peptidase (beta-lactamase class C family)